MSRFALMTKRARKPTGPPPMGKPLFAGRSKSLFMAGYVAAIHDIERTGLQPFRDDTIRQSAERAWNDHAPLSERR